MGPSERCVRKIPFENFPVAPRKVEPSPTLQGILFGLMMLQFLVFVPAFFTRSAAREHHRKRAYGRSAPARVVAIGNRVDKNRREVKVAFRASQAETSEWGTVPLESMNGYEVGAKTWVSFDPKDLTDPFIGTNRKEWPEAGRSFLSKASFWTTPFCALGMLFAVGLYWRQRKWTAKSNAYSGHVVFRKLRRNPAEGEVIEYSWQEEGRHRADQMSSHPTASTSLQAGDRVLVLVDSRGKSRLSDTLWAVDVAPIESPEKGSSTSEAVP
ncbi:DUF3592 domain-containing protein [bacterium]|nr:MAG: DUF3592 domain-containing protein [bacterium]